MVVQSDNFVQQTKNDLQSFASDRRKLSINYFLGCVQLCVTYLKLSGQKPAHRRCANVTQIGQSIATISCCKQESQLSPTGHREHMTLNDL